LAINIALYLLLFPIAFSSPTTLSQGDIDSDGIHDRLEQLLLEKFAPKFMLSEEECDALPSEFLPQKQEPQLMVKNGTVYGQVFPIVRPDKPGIFVEIHYYHLWNRDCGFNGHVLDAEHVSVLLSADVPSDSTHNWKAEYWYAAAHEDTVCDSSHGTCGSFIDAEQHGPTVWISKGKHASYLDREICQGGCGGDDCSQMYPMKISKIINLGEPGAPMNGVSWVEWQGWALADKMQTDFPEKVLAKLKAADPPSIVSVNNAQAPVKTAIHIGGSTAGALIVTNSKTGIAISSAGGAVGTSLDKSRTDVGNALVRTFRAVWKGLGGGAEDKMEETKD